MLLLTLQIPGKAQQVLSLEKCIAIALEKNIQLLQLDFSRQSAEANYQQTKYEFLPNLNGNWSYSQSWGRTFDMNVFRPVTASTGSSNISLSSSVTLFNGLRNHFNMKAKREDLAASEYAIQRMKNDLTTNVAYNFFQVVYGRENLRIAEKRFEIAQKQLEKVEIQYKAGVLTQSEVYSLKSQVASENLAVVNARSILAKGQLALAQLMEMDPEVEFELEIPQVSAIQLDGTVAPLEQIYQTALSTMPEIRQQEAKINASEYNLKATQALRYPSITLNGGLYTSYSSNGVLDPETFQRVQVPYFEQLPDNFRQGVTLSMNIPVFNRLQTHTSVQLSQISLRNARLEYNNQRNMLEKNIQTAYLDMKSSAEKYAATTESLKALEEAYQYAEVKFSKGLVDYYSYSKTLNDKNLAEIELLNAKYDFILKKAVLDVYQGNPLKF